jgi:hypothetical protein
MPYLVRHAHAGDKRVWQGRDLLRRCRMLAAGKPKVTTIPVVAHTISSGGTLSVIGGQTNTVTATVPWARSQEGS